MCLTCLNYAIFMYNIRSYVQKMKEEKTKLMQCKLLCWFEMHIVQVLLHISMQS